MSEAYAFSQGRPLFVSRITPTIARVYIEQGRLKEARDLLDAALTLYEREITDEDELDESSHVIRSRGLLAAIETLQGNWQKAEEIYRLTDRRSVAWGYTLLKLGRVKDALQMFNGILKSSNKRYDERSLNLWENRAFHALAIGASGQKAEAVKTLAVALPKILEMSRPDGSSGEAGLLNTTRLNWLIEGYITLLVELYRSGTGVEGIDLVSEAFRYSDVARGSRVQGALSAAIVRATVSDRTLASVIRNAQSLQYQVKVTAEYLTALQAGDSNPEKEKLIAVKRAELGILRAANEDAQNELKRKLPDYSELLNPQLLGISGTQKLLRPREALISIYSTEQRTLIWAVPAQGSPQLAVLDLSSSAVAALVAKLRKSLDPSKVNLSQISSFDFSTAHDLYQKLLAPVKLGWQDAQELIVVSHGSLSELPFAVLVTDSFRPSKEGIPFANHTEAPWLIKQAAVSYLPSVAGLTALRRGAMQAAELRFIGFGDPVFAAEKPSDIGAEMTSRGLQRENLGTDTRQGGGQLESLPPLPDTAQEVREIAKILQAEEARDIYLGRRASENRVKTSELFKYRIVMFATHGLIPGDLTDLSQPALALSNPRIVEESEDGLLTLTEILGLKLQAEWVVLSACNTASADGQASEGVSGLGRAFFFAGAKALLVSHWPVETVSARLLTTEVFKRQSADSKLGRAKAMQQASLAVMKQAATGRARPYSYAHPAFWAPFVVVGDGG
jgi:CHAT domain-containing protein